MYAYIPLATLLFCASSSAKLEENSSAPTFQVEYEWTHINFTWENQAKYQDAINAKRYIPENNAMAGIKYYKEKLYIAMPRIRDGATVTLGYIPTDQPTPRRNPPIAPFPNWEANDWDGNCDKLESVQSMEIDADGIMWVIDGHRTKPASKCPPKLVLYDLNDNNRVVQSYTFPETICLSRGGFLNDIVVDDNDGGFAYITEHSTIDPGLIVFSRKQNHAWKFRDASMFARRDAASFDVDGLKVTRLSPIDGIALSPCRGRGSRKVFYCTLFDSSLYSISTDFLKREESVAKGDWRFNVSLVGEKQAPSDGMVVDKKGNLYYGLLPLYGVGSWNVNEEFSKAKVVDQNRESMVWTDSFAFDDKGFLYLLANNINKFFNLSFKIELTNDVKFRVLKYFTSTKSYLF